MRNVYIIGAGMTKFGRHEGKDILELGAEACFKAIEDADIYPKEIEAGYCGCSHISPQSRSLPGQKVFYRVGIKEIPVINNSTACTSSSVCFYEAYKMVAAGVYNVAIVCGVEKMTHLSTEEAINAIAYGSDVEVHRGLNFPGIYAMAAVLHMQKYNTTREQMAMVVVKNRKNGALNPYARIQKPVTVEEVLKSPPIVYPLTLFECCPNADGASAVILASEEIAKRCDLPIKVVTSVYVTGNYDMAMQRDPTTNYLTLKASSKAYKIAGINDPKKDLDLIEVHDAFSIAEIIHCEDLGLCKKGEGGKIVEDGVTAIDGEIPVNASGGLLSKGHPVGATGTGQIVELVEQLRGEAGKRQVKGAKRALALNHGGYFYNSGASCTLTILERGD
ncbi:MAG: thiolase family protein [Archaeoglobaceae archaeon]